MPVVKKITTKHTCLTLYIQYCPVNLYVLFVLIENINDSTIRIKINFLCNNLSQGQFTKVTLAPNLGQLLHFTLKYCGLGNAIYQDYIPVITHAYDWYFGGFNNLNEFLHSTAIFIASHSINFIHDKYILCVMAGSNLQPQFVKKKFYRYNGHNPWAII